jgi:precorrin-6x reductase
MTDIARSGWQYVLGALRNTDHVKKTRKHLFQEMGSKNSVARFNDIQVAEVSRFLVRVLDKPENLLQHIRK